MTTIEPHPDAPLGSVTTRDSWSPKDIANEDAILCRNSAPLIATAFGLILARRAVNVIGRDIGQGLSSLVKKLSPTTIPELYTRLTDYQMAKTDDLIEKGKDAQVQGVIDRCECVRIFAQNSSSIEDLLSNIKAMFSDKAESSRITLATVHKAKGLEWNNVFILNRWLMPSKFATQQWQIQQENNIIYVAITRAKLNLVYIDSNGFKP